MYPAIVSITSQGDLATRFILPVGQGASLFKKSLRDHSLKDPAYDDPSYDKDPFGIAKQRSYYLRSATHIPQLQSHVVGSAKDITRATYDASGYTCASIRSATGGPKANYYVVPIAGAANKTPYWIMQMPVEIVSDYSNVFRLEFATLLEAFALRQVQEHPNKPPPYDDCYSDPTTAPKIDMRQSISTTITVKARQN
jgi:hypothetical protein